MIFIPILCDLLTGIEKNNNIRNVTAVPTRKHEKLKAHAFGIYNELIVASIAETLAAIIVDVNAKT